MNRKTYSICALVAFFLLLPITASRPVFAQEIEIAQQVTDEEKSFEAALAITARRVLAFKDKRISPLRKINDSYELLAKAVYTLTVSENIPEAIEMLKEASDLYDDNRFALLLLGVAYERIGNTDKAGEYYQKFYVNSYSFVPIERNIMNRSIVETFRDYIEMRLTEWNMQIPEEDIPLTAKKIRALFAIDRSALGAFLGTILPLVILLGLALILLTFMTGLEFPGWVRRYFPRFYILTVIAYLLWVMHLFLGIGFFYSIETEFGLLFGIGTILILTVPRIKSFIRDKKELRISEARKCPHCNKFVNKLLTECPHCRNKLD